MEIETIGALIQIVYSFSILICLGILFSKTEYSWYLGIIPFVNLYFIIKIIKKPIWWLLLIFVPLVNFIIVMIILRELFNKFNLSGWGVLIYIFFPYVYMFYLANSNLEYQKSEMLDADLGI